MMKRILIILNKIINWRRWLITHKLFDVLDFVLLKHTDTFHELPARIKQEWRSMGSYRELVNIYQAIQLTNKLYGDIAEFGVGRGGISKLIASASPNKTIHLFDTFTGVPQQDSEYDDIPVGSYASDINEVTDYLGHFSNVVFHAGFFPDTAKDLTSRFSFVYMDANQYQSTYDGLAYFYPRLVRGGMMISHDYSMQICRGVKQAIIDFSKINNLVYFPIWDCSVLIVNTRKD